MSTAGAVAWGPTMGRGESGAEMIKLKIVSEIWMVLGGRVGADTLRLVKLCDVVGRIMCR